MFGAGGSDWTGSNYTSEGGGVLQVDAQHLFLRGTLSARSPDGHVTRFTSAAGGTIHLDVDRLSGPGTIDASAGNTRPASCAGGDNVPWDGVGGGGRVALYVDELDGFDPASQVKVFGGAAYSCGHFHGHGSPGTLYMFGPDSTYGELIIDSGDYNPDFPVPATHLPVLGEGAASLVVDGQDAWLQGPSPFLPRWLGAWVDLLAVDGSSLGRFRAIELDAQGALRLQGAATAGAATAYRGVYRFDQVSLRRGGGLFSQDHLDGANFVLNGDIQLSGEMSASNLTLESGSVVRPVAGLNELHLKVTGTLTVEAGAVIDVSGLGYLNGYPQHTDGESPPWIESVATRDAGGSHGGRGQGWHSGAGGETYDSVYLPMARGAGGSWGGDTSGDFIPGRRGGGVLVIEAGSVQLDGTLKALSDIGYKFADASGAGGTIRIHAGSLSGTGVIDASAERTDEGSCAGGTSLGEGSGGGGRVALWVDSFDGFDLLSQVRALGGRHYTCGGLLGYSAPGTVFYKTPEQAYGTLLVGRWWHQCE